MNDQDRISIKITGSDGVVTERAAIWAEIAPSLEDELGDLESVAVVLFVGGTVRLGGGASPVIDLRADRDAAAASAYRDYAFDAAQRGWADAACSFSQLSDWAQVRAGRLCR